MEIREAVVAAPAPLGTGGLGGAAAEFADGLEALGCRASYVGIPPLGPATRVARSRPFRRLFGKGPGRRAVSRSVRRAVPAEGWDLVWACPGAAPVGRGRGVSVVHQATRHPALHWEATRRGERETGGQGTITRAEVRRCEYELRRADLVHVTTDTVREQLLDAGIEAERIVQAPLGVDLARFRPGRKNEVLTIAFVGPLSMSKGVDAAAELAVRLGDEARVEAVGGPSCRWSRGVVEAAPFVHGESVAATLAGAHFLVLPSRSDGFSYTVLEALASGAVPIVTPEVGAAEVVRALDPRLVVPREGFAEEVAALLPRLDLERLAPAARELAEGFDRERTAPRVAGAVLERAKGLAPR
jgi:glycosyltransferase involved in cell wall biosynthesis